MDTNNLYDSSDKDKVAPTEQNIMPQDILLVDSAAVTKSSRQDLMVLAAEIEKADSYIKANVNNQLQVIADQIRFLQSQAKGFLLKAKKNMKLHHVTCNFVKQPGHVYHLYQRESGQLYFSMLSPEEWGDSMPSQGYKGSFRLEHDRTWTQLPELRPKDSALDILEKLLSPNQCTNYLHSVMSISNT